MQQCKFGYWCNNLHLNIRTQHFLQSSCKRRESVCTSRTMIFRSHWRRIWCVIQGLVAYGLCGLFSLDRSLWKGDARVAWSWGWVGWEKEMAVRGRSVELEKVVLMQLWGWVLVVVVMHWSRKIRGDQRNVAVRSWWCVRGVAGGGMWEVRQWGMELGYFRLRAIYDKRKSEGIFVKLYI